MEDLPKGLLATATQVSSELDSLDVIDLAQIIQLWKIYNANPSVHEGHTGHRLENFFWRTWSSEQLRGSIGGSRLASLFMRISEPTPFSMQQFKEGQSITRKPDNPPTPVPPPLFTAATQNRPTPKKSHYVAPKTRNIKRRPVVMRRKSSQNSAASTRNHSPQLSPLTAESPPPFQGQTSVFEEPVEETLIPTPEPAPAEVLIPAISTAAEINPPVEADDDLDNKPIQLPPAFLSELKTILRKKKSSPPHSAKSTPSKWGFVTTDDWTHYDVRYVCPENYEQPSAQSLIDKGFRSRFSERLHQEQEFYSSSLAAANAAGMNLAEYLEATSAGSSRTADAAPSPLKTESHIAEVETSTTATSVPIMTPSRIDSSSPCSRRASVLPLTPFSLSRGRSQLSLLIEESRKKDEKDLDTEEK
ncbi:predicted protein [Aspergillus terreus NIH2624]|uniref:Nitrogen regulatory protein areA GATA-like domain-containing protein n=1 Tax=Aspergillus terreus (strain NIH 2624 / FGSC A1156) TaxID=341663 RepID=Q0CIA6_ASPTN|nr:uncharacterized protein ATEG_06578 [Aspergillus terreus NIH2624]EAU33122.1 predicted protein [Aspergillus terreus NIH2624]